MSYNFSSTSSGQGNWNTGGTPTGQGSLAGGIRDVSGTGRYGVEPMRNPDTGRLEPPREGFTPGAPGVGLGALQTAERMDIRSPQHAPWRSPTAVPINYTRHLTGAPPWRVDLNPATLASWRGVGLRNGMGGFRGGWGEAYPGYPGSTHYQTSGPASGSFRSGDPSVSYGNDRYGASLNDGPASDRPGGERGGGGGGGWRKGGNVDKPSVLKRIMARTKPKMAIDPSARATKKSSPVPARKPLSKVTQRVTNKRPPTKTPWKRGGSRPAFAKGGAVEKFMARYPNFKLA